MKRKCLIGLCFFVIFNIEAQSKRILHCGYGPCTSAEMESFEFLQSTQEFSDTTSAYHLLANFFAENENNLDSTIYYLDKVQLRNKNLINNLYAFSLQKTEDLAKSEHHYFVGRHPILKNRYVDIEWVKEHFESINGRGKYEDPFIHKLDSLDQNIRFSIKDIENKIRVIQNEDGQVKSLNSTLDSLYKVMQSNDKLVRKLLLEKLKNEKSYFSKRFSNMEKLGFQTLLLHAGKDLLDLEELLILMHNENILSNSSLALIVGRHYCVRYNHSPVSSPHCELDSNLQTKLKKEFPQVSAILIN